MLGNKHALISVYLGPGQQGYWAVWHCDWACGVPLCLWHILFPPVQPPPSPHLFECSVLNSAQPQGGPSRLSICDGQGPYPHRWANVVNVLCYLQTALPPPRLPQHPQALPWASNPAQSQTARCRGSKSRWRRLPHAAPLFSPSLDLSLVTWNYSVHSEIIKLGEDNYIKSSRFKPMCPYTRHKA